MNDLTFGTLNKQSTSKVGKIKRQSENDIRKLNRSQQNCCVFFSDLTITIYEIDWNELAGILKAKRVDWQDRKLVWNLDMNQKIRDKSKREHKRKCADKWRSKARRHYLYNDGLIEKKLLMDIHRSRRI